jgi:hypothetical protein
LSIRDFGIILRLETEMIVLRHTFKFDGSFKANSGMCDMICKVFNRLHMRFIEAPIAAAMKAFATTPPVKEVSIT